MSEDINRMIGRCYEQSRIIKIDKLQAENEALRKELELNVKAIHEMQDYLQQERDAHVKTKKELAELKGRSCETCQLKPKCRTEIKLTDICSSDLANNNEINFYCSFHTI